jgi:hypothetical protein
VVLKGGQIAEQGTHWDLYAANGLYRDIFDLQLQPQEELIRDAALPAELTVEAGDGN